MVEEPELKWMQCLDFLMAPSRNPDHVGGFFQIQPAPGYCNVYLTQSPHSGATVALLGDGSVRMVAPTISTTTWTSACVPIDGAVLGSDW